MSFTKTWAASALLAIVSTPSLRAEHAAGPVGRSIEAKTNAR